MQVVVPYFDNGDGSDGTPKLNKNAPNNNIVIPTLFTIRKLPSIQ